MSYILSVGWDKKINVWADEKEEEVEVTKMLPQSDQNHIKIGHEDDIMSAVFCLQNNMIYTGGHDGTIFVWSFETGRVK